MPCLRNFWPCASPLPLCSGPTTNDACPRAPSAGSTAATTTCTSAIPPLVIQVFTPLSTQVSLASSYTARVRIADTSEPAPGSLTARAPRRTSVSVPNIAGAHSTTCSKVPLATTAAAARVVPTIDSPMPASPQNSSSMTIGSESPVSSSRALAKKSRE